MPSLLTEHGFNTWLACLLHQQRRVDLQTLQTLLVESRDDRGRTLAQALCDRGLLAEPELEALLQQLMVSETLAPLVETRQQGPGPAWQPGTSVDGYRIEGELGAGGMGVVYRVTHGITGVVYALKTLIAGADPELILRFQREGIASPALTPTPTWSGCTPRAWPRGATTWSWTWRLAATCRIA